MSLKKTIEADLKTALLSAEKETVNTLRGLKATILNAEVAAGVRDKGLSEEETQTLIQKEVKKRKESIDLYRTNAREDLAKAEEFEVEILSRYLPKQLDDTELDSIIDDTILSFGDVTAKDMGRIIGAVKSKVGNTADGSAIAQKVKEKLAK